MKIVSVECLILDGDYPFVKVHTDEGITGIGECFRRQPGVTKALIEEHLAPAIVGKDPLDTSVRFRDMMGAGSAVEMGGAVFCAIAGLDIALWDIKGKAFGVPIYKLLGGKIRDKGEGLREFDASGPDSAGGGQARGIVRGSGVQRVQTAQRGSWGD